MTDKLRFKYPPSVLASSAALAVSGLVFVGWLCHSVMLARTFPGRPPMTPWTATCLFFVALALFITQKFQETWPSRRLSLVAAGILFIPVAASFGMLVEHWFPFGSGLDRFLVPSALEAFPATNAGRMSPNTAACVIILSLMTLLITSVRGRLFMLMQRAVVFTQILALLALVGNIYLISFLAGVNKDIGMAIPTSLCVIFCGTSLLTLRKDSWAMELFQSEHSGGILIRRLFWAAVFLPLAIACVISTAQNLGLIDGALGSSIFVIITISAFASLIVWTGKRIGEVELERINLITEQTARKRAEDAVKERDTFLSICSHELRTPVTSMKLQYQMARKQIQKGDLTLFEPENVKKRIEQTNKQINRLVRLIEDMLDISRVTSGRLILDLSKVDLVEVVQELIDDLKEQFETMGTTVDIKASVPVFTLCDRHWIEQVITKLLSNAGLKYGAGQPIQITIRAEDQQAIILVRDRGIGISPEDRERIFDRFERGVSPNMISGLGLGLFISKQIVEAHRGKIEVDSQLGIGSTFTVRLPLQMDSF